MKARNTRGHKNERKESDDSFSPDREMDMITLSEGQFDRQPWVNPDGAAVTDEEVPSGPISGYSGSFFLGEVSWPFVRPEARGSASGSGGAGRSACGGWWRGRSRLWRRVSKGVVAIVRRLGEGWVDRRVGHWRGELTY